MRFYHLGIELFRLYVSDGLVWHKRPMECFKQCDDALDLCFTDVVMRDKSVNSILLDVAFDFVCSKVSPELTHVHSAVCDLEVNDIGVYSKTELEPAKLGQLTR